MTLPKLPKFLEQALAWMTFTRVTWGFMATSLAFILATGQEMVDRKIQETMRPQMDSLKSEVREVNDKMDALIEIVIVAVPGAKEAAENRAETLKEKEEIRNLITGGN